MSQVILTNWTIFFADDAPAASSGSKQIMWTGAGGPETNTNTVNELYSEINHYFSLAANNDADDTIPMNAVTATEYEIGRFDAGDDEAWFIDPESIQHLTGGSIQTVGWTRIQDSVPGIVKVAYSLGTQFVDSDIGRAVSHTDGDGGILLWYDSANNEAWIRPDTSGSADNWDATSGTITATGGTGSVTQTAGAVTGERLWSNVQTIGNIQANTRIYVAQEGTVLTNFWGDGLLDRLFLVEDNFDVGLIDEGDLTFFARQYSKTYDNFIVNTAAGGRNLAVLSTLDDGLNNPTGIRTVTVTGSSSAFSTGEVVTGGTTGARGVVLTNTGSPTTSFTYYLIGDLTDFNSSETLTGSIVGANGSTSGAPSDNGPATYAGITITFGQIDETFVTSQAFTSEVIATDTSHPFATGNVVDYDKEGGTATIGLTEGTLYYVNNIDATSISLHLTEADASADTSRVNLTTNGSETHRLKRVYDVDKDDVKESYSIIVDCNTFDLSQMYEYFKYINRRGSTTNLNGIEGQQYIGNDYRIDYVALTGSINTGDTVTQTVTDGSAEGVVQLHNTVDGFIVLRDSEGTFETGTGAANLEVDGTNFVTMTTGATTEVIVPEKRSPLGTIAGGLFFGARGVFLENFDTLDANNVQFIDDSGATKTPPLTVTFQLTNLQTDSEIRLYDSSLPDGQATELAGTESSGTTFSYQYEYAGDITAHVMIHHHNYVWQRINNITLSSVNQSIPIQQIPDRNYANP